jgi:hypothetical protein
MAALYVRFAYPSESVYSILEPLLCQYNQVAVLRDTGYEVQHFDEVIHCFLKDKFWCGITFPPLTPRPTSPLRLSPLNHLREELRAEIYENLGMTPDGQLIEQIEAKKQLRVKGLKLKGRRSGKPKPKPEPAPQAAPVVDEIEEENRIRAMLGLPPLK